MKKQNLFHSTVFKGLGSSAGFSLIEIMVVASIGLIIALGMSTMLSSFGKDFRAFDEKVEIQGLQLRVQNLLSNPAYCKCFIGNNTVDYSANPKVWNSFPTTMNASYESDCTPAGSALLSVGDKIGNSNILPASMEFENITETVVGSGKFSADLVVNFDQEVLTRSRKGISIPMNFSLKMVGPEPVTAKPISSCGAVGATIALSTTVTDVDGGFTYRGGPALPVWRQRAADFECPTNSVMTGIIINTSGTARNQANGDGPIIQSLWLKCRAFQ